MYSKQRYEDRFPGYSIFEKMAFCVLPNPPSDGPSVPVLRYSPSHGAHFDHLLCHDRNEIGVDTVGQKGKHGFEFIENLGFMYQNDQPGMNLKPVFRFFHRDQYHHAYSLNAFEFGRPGWDNRIGPWNFEGLVGYTTTNC